MSSTSCYKEYPSIFTVKLCILYIYMRTKMHRKEEKKSGGKSLHLYICILCETKEGISLFHSHDHSRNQCTQKRRKQERKYMCIHIYIYIFHQAKVFYTCIPFLHRDKGHLLWKADFPSQLRENKKKKDNRLLKNCNPRILYTYVYI